MEINTTDIPVGVVGLGLMGCSITTCFAMAGHPVVAIAPVSGDLKHAGSRIRTHLESLSNRASSKNGPNIF